MRLREPEHFDVGYRRTKACLRYYGQRVGQGKTNFRHRAPTGRDRLELRAAWPKSLSARTAPPPHRSREPQLAWRRVGTEEGALPEELASLKTLNKPTLCGPRNRAMPQIK
jgi:hypothetical protein